MYEKLTKAQVASLLKKEGFPDDVIPTMVAIAGGESGYNPNAMNPDVSTGDQSYGLFQINMLGAMGPERRKEFGIKSNDELYNPITNVRAAKKIFDSQGLGAWGAYTNKSYLNHLPQQNELNAMSQDFMQVSLPPGNTGQKLPYDPMRVNDRLKALEDQSKKQEPRSFGQDLINSLVKSRLNQSKTSVDPVDAMFKQMKAGIGYVNPEMILNQFLY